MINPFEGWRISSNYGWREHPISGQRKHHNGIDIVKEHKYPITPFMTGRVIRVGGMGTAGNVVIIEDYNFFTHRYYHLHISNAFLGQIVGWNDIIGLQGSTGNSTGSHLHYEIRDENGKAVEPTQYLRGEYMNYQKQLDEIKSKINNAELDIKKFYGVTEETPPPAWFVEQFKDMRIENIILEMKGSRDFWRGVAISHRLIEYHRANYKFDTE